jgi:hypothetical protein
VDMVEDSSLRRHDPDQVRRSERQSLPLSPAIPDSRVCPVSLDGVATA